MVTSFSPLLTGDGGAQRFRLAEQRYAAGDFPGAITLLLELIAEHQVDGVEHGLAATRLLLARAYFHTAQLGRAEHQVRVVLDESPCDSYALLLLGRTLQRLGRGAEATAYLAQARALGTPAVQS